MNKSVVQELVERIQSTLAQYHAANPNLREYDVVNALVHFLALQVVNGGQIIHTDRVRIQSLAEMIANDVKLIRKATNTPEQAGLVDDIGKH